MTPRGNDWMPAAENQPFSRHTLLIAAGLVAALALLVAFIDVVQSSAERGDRLRAAQAAHRQALAQRDPRDPTPLPAHLTVALVDEGVQASVLGTR